MEKWAVMQEPTSTTWWSIGRGTCMEVVRNQETHAGRSAAVKMIMASQITGPTCPAVTRCQITQPYVFSSLLPRLLASLLNRLGGTAPPTAQEKPRPRLLNRYSKLILYPWIAPAPWSKASRKRRYTCTEYTARPSRSRRTPDGRSVWHAALRMERASYCVCTHMWDGN